MHEAVAVQVQRRQPHLVHIRVAGELDQANLEPLRRALTDLADLRPDLVTLDLTGVEFMSCAAMRYLLDARTGLPGLRIVAASAPVRRLAALLRSRAPCTCWRTSGSD